MSLVEDFNNKIKNAADILDVTENDIILLLISHFLDGAFLEENYDFEEIDVEAFFEEEFSDYKFENLYNPIVNEHIEPRMGASGYAFLTISNGEEFLQIKYMVDSYGEVYKEYSDYEVKKVKPVERVQIFYE